MKINNYIDQLHGLYDQIPTFSCIKNCTDCCGPIFMTGLEHYLIKKPAVFTGLTSCPWRGKGHCRIYEQRPMICRLYGTINEKRLLCSFGRSPVFLMPSDFSMRLLRTALEISIAAGFPRMHNTHDGIINHFVSPTKIKIELKGYQFNE